MLRATILSLLALATIAPAAPAGAPAAPRRIVSLNLCGDQLLLALADPGQIAGLTPFARDPAMSAEVARAARIPVTPGTIEDVLAIDPDLILGSPFKDVRAMSRLAGKQYRTVDLGPAESYGQIRDQIRVVARAVGHPERGETMIRRMDADLAALAAGAPRLPRAPVAAYYQRRGYLTGTGTLIDDLMRRIGLRNLAGTLGKPSLARLSVEEMVAAHPDYIIVETATDTVTDQGTEMLHHPALADIPRLRLPQAWTVCGGPAYVLAARSLSNQIRAARR